MYSQYPRMRPLRFVIWRLRHSRLRRQFHIEIADAVARFVPSGWALDVGCGPGLLAARIMRGSPGARVVCLDVEPGMLRAARSSGCGDLVRASADHIPFRSGVFGTVMSTASLKDWANRSGGLAEMARVLGPGRRGFVYDFITVGPGSNPPGFIRRFGPFAEMIRRLMARKIPFSMRDFDDLGGTLRSAGLETATEPVEGFGAARIVFTKGAPR